MPSPNFPATATAEFRVWVVPESFRLRILWVGHRELGASPKGKYLQQPPVSLGILVGDSFKGPNKYNYSPMIWSQIGFCSTQPPALSILAFILPNWLWIGPWRCCTLVSGPLSVFWVPYTPTGRPSIESDPQRCDARISPGLTKGFPHFEEP